jgi:tRNA(adenine34) deaminase
MNDPDQHIALMRLALQEAEKAALLGEVPIGALIIDSDSGEILAKTHNETITRSDPTAHAEILALRQVCAIKEAQRIPGCTLYVTIEPCPMCASAISFARFDHIYFGATDIKSGGFVSGPNLMSHAALHHKPGFTGGVLGDEAAALMQKFFKERR